MKEDNYPKAYQEVLEILKSFPKEKVEKIPTDMLTMFKTMQAENHNFKIDPSKKLEEQPIKKETKAILFILFRDYWAIPEERKRMIQRENYEMNLLEQKKREKYNPDDLFKNRRKKSKDEE